MTKTKKTTKLNNLVGLFLSIISVQLVGILGSVATINSIPGWYKFLDKPTFAPPNWVFGPVWTVLYTLIGISFYRTMQIKDKQRGSIIKTFLVHLFLNAIWSPIFFGFKNLGFAFIVIVLMVVSLLVLMARLFRKDKLATYLLVPYAIWISFASVLNFSIWQLNKDKETSIAFAQVLDSNTAKNDYIYSEDNYKSSLDTYRLKRDSYIKNPTLSLKEELRLSLLDLLKKRNLYKKSYLNLIRAKVVESQGLEESEKQAVYEKIDPEVVYYQSRSNEYSQTIPLEDLTKKSEEEDLRYSTDTLQAAQFSLIYLSIGQVVDIKNRNLKIYNDLKSEADNIVKLGRADQSLFERWFKDVDQELSNISNSISETKTSATDVFSSDSFISENSYRKGIEKISPVKENLLKLNKYIIELETTISEKR